MRLEGSLGSDSLCGVLLEDCAVDHCLDLDLDLALLVVSRPLGVVVACGGGIAPRELDCWGVVCCGLVCDGVGSGVRQL